ncbi:hypothetical protein O181_036557 [Austropuccinia psidii MF-1]|uniref:Uncharacterized protein n=1 Tax=Austropuccinia psidii MF-1 TaxID=1389203 RepID=A0A9Q3HA18_9BASI|nr:hypothetical protein [Austropuccinia psidii MF-1]
MTPTRSGRNYSIQSNRSGLGHSSQKCKRQACHPRGEAQRGDARTSTSSQILASIFDTLLGSPEAEITAIPFSRSEPFPKVNSRNIPVSVQELVYGSKAEGVGASSKPLDKDNQLLSSIKEALGPRKDRGPSEVLDTHVFQRKIPKYNILVGNPKNFFRGPEEIAHPKEGQKPGGSS